MSKISKLLLAFCAWLVLASKAFAVAPENGWWWNPSESGSGYAIERQGNSIFMAAFLYETSSAATWYATLLSLQPDGTYKGDMTRYVGGKSLLGSYKAPTSTSVVANATASFAKPDSGSMTISFPNGAPTRTIPISRFAFASPSFEPSKGNFQSGWWWNDQESGTGYFIEVQGTSAFIASFMYDTSGQPTWYASLSNLSGTTSLSGPLDTYANGQALGGTYKVPTASAGAAGSMSYGFTGESFGSMTLPNSSKVAIKRFAFDPVAVTNHAPVPNAGANQTVNVGDTVTLIGTGTDTDGDNLTFSWRFLTAPTGSTTTLNAWNTSKASFVADVAGTYRLELIADDGKVSNGGSVVSVTANTKAVANIAPVANAGPNQYVSVGATVNLNGSASSDANGDALTYSWTFISKPTGSAAILASSTSTNPFFTPDIVGVYLIGLVVNDGKIASLRSTITVNAINSSIYNPSSISRNAITSFIASAPPFNTQYYDMPYNDTIYEDINQDGLTDIIMVPTHYNSARNSYDINGLSWPMMKIKYFQNNGDGTFSDKTDAVFIGNKFYSLGLARYIYADLDSDGLKDLLILDTGYEARGGNYSSTIDLTGEIYKFPDGLSVLSYWKRGKDNNFTRVFIDNDMYASYHHQITAGDTNGDGKKEIYSATMGFPSIKITKDILNNYEKEPLGIATAIGGVYTNHPLTLSSNLIATPNPIEPWDFDGSKFIVNQNILPDDMTKGKLQRKYLYDQLATYSVKAVDIDGDGYDDLIVGVSVQNYYYYNIGPVGNNLLYFGSKQGLVPNSLINLKLPQKLIDNINPIVGSNISWSMAPYKILVGDLDGNGLNDIVFIYQSFQNTGPAPNAGVVSYIQILMQTRPRVFVDSTANIWGDYNIAMNNQYSPKNLPDYLADIDGDGCMDIVVEMRNVYLNNGSPVGYMKNDCKGVFTAVYLNGLNESDYQPNTLLTIKGLHPKFTFGWGKFNNSAEYDLIAIKNEIAGDNISNSSYINGYITKRVKALGAQ